MLWLASSVLRTHVWKSTLSAPSGGKPVRDEHLHVQYMWYVQLVVCYRRFWLPLLASGLPEFLIPHWLQGVSLWAQRGLHTSSGRRAGVRSSFFYSHGFFLIGKHRAGGGSWSMPSAAFTFTYHLFCRLKYKQHQQAYRRDKWNMACKRMRWFVHPIG